MNSTQSDSSAETPGVDPGQAQQVAAGISQLVYNTLNHAWLSKKDETEGIAAFYDYLTQSLDTSHEIALRIAGDVIRINEHEIIDDDKLIQDLGNQLAKLGINHLAFHHGLSAAGLRNLREVICADPNDIEALGGFASAIEQCGIESVSSKTIVFKEVADEDVVISQEELESAEKEREQAEALKKRVVNMADVLSHLKADSDDEQANEIIEELQEMAGDARQLADMIIQAAEERHDDAEDQTKETLAGALAGCVRRTFDALMKDPSVRTQKGKKELQKKLKALEGELLGMMSQVGEGQREDCAESVRETVDQLADEIQVDSLASEYMKRLRAIDKTEKRLMRYIKTKGADGIQGSELEMRLQEDGIDLSEWDTLLQRNGIGGGVLGPGPGGGGYGGLGPGDGGSSATMEHLSSLLGRMEKAVGELATSPDIVHEEALTGVLTEVNEEIGEMVDKSARRMQTIAEDVRADAEAVDAAEEAAVVSGEELRLPRKDLLAVLAEIVQELMQPLAVINCSTDMIMSQKLGELPETQASMLGLIGESTGRLETLIHGLQDIAGVPDTMSPDQGLIGVGTGEKAPSS